MTLSLETKKIHSVIFFNKDGNEINIFVDNILIAYISVDGDFIFLQNDNEEIEVLKKAGLSIDKDGYVVSSKE